MFKKIIFLVKTKAPLNLIKYYIKFILYYKFSKLNKIHKENHLKFLKNKKITNDWFSKNCYHFFCIKNLIKKKINYLEIGSFEGNSLMFILKNFNTKFVCSVDTWKGSDEHKNLNMKIIENNFDYNLKEFKNKFTKEKKTSDSFFKFNKKYFDLIYIDGSHEFKQVQKDCKNSWFFLNRGGIIIFDDYFWNYYKNLFKNPAYAINCFLKTIKNKYKVILLTNTKIFIKKI
jgi:predicted O-methyltransferase YrrM